jgi:hypothetical protein
MKGKNTIFRLDGYDEKKEKISPYLILLILVFRVG